MVRVTKPGGLVVVLVPDWSTASINTPEFDLEWRLSRYRLEQLIRNGMSAVNSSVSSDGNS
jgi:hypothetical protein